MINISCGAKCGLNVLFAEFTFCCSEEYFVIPDFWQGQFFQNGAS